MTIDYAAKVNELLDSLKASANYHAYSGLTAENISDNIVKIFDDYMSGRYYADHVIEALGKADPVDWSKEVHSRSAVEHIWDALAPCECPCEVPPF